MLCQLFVSRCCHDFHNICVSSTIIPASDHYVKHAGNDVNNRLRMNHYIHYGTKQLIRSSWSRYELSPTVAKFDDYIKNNFFLPAPRLSLDWSTYKLGGVTKSSKFWRPINNNRHVFAVRETSGNFTLQFKKWSADGVSFIHRCTLEVLLFSPSAFVTIKLSRQIFFSRQILSMSPDQKNSIRHL